MGSASLTQRKTFFVNLRNPTNAIVNNAYATGTILTGNAVQDFSISTNTNTSTDTWQYGGVALDGSGFIRDTDNTGSINAGAIIAWKTPNSLGGITFNTSGVNQYYNIHTNQPADELGMFAGTGDKAILRWLAPASGTYAVTGLFRAIDQSDADVAIIKNENVAVGAALFSDIVLGNQNAKPFSLNVTVNAGDTLDFRVGFGNDGFSYSGTSLKVSITQNVGPPPLPAITTVSKTGPNTPGGNIHFACTTQAGLNGAVGSAAGNVRVQYTTDATFAEGNWTDIPNGTATEGTAGSYTLDTTAYPLASGVYFRFVSTKNGFTDGKSGNTLLGPFNLSNTIVFGETDPTTPGGPIKFHATTAPGWVVRVQTTTKAAPVEVDWSDLNDGNSGHMTESGTTPGSYSLDSTSYPAGAAVSFRAIASKATFTDVVSVRLVVSNLRQAALSIGATLSSSSDWAAGRTAYIDDYLIYKLTVKNSGDGNAKTLKVTATVPTFLYADIPVLVRTVAGSNIIALASGNTSQLMLGGTFASGPGTGGAVVGNPNGTKFYIPLTATITAINPDGMHFTISQPAINSSGTSTVSLLVQYGSARKQFLESDLSLSPGGAYVPETSPGAGNAKLVWNNIGDLPGAPGLVYSQYVTFSVHLTSKVRTEQALGIGNDYSVASTASPVQPMAGSTGFLSNAPNPSCQINGSISFLLSSVSTNPRSNPLAAAPGGYITYTFVLFNRGTSAATNPVAVVEMPDFTRFAASYDNGMKGVFVTSGTVASKLVYHTGSPVPQVVLKFSSLAAKTSLQVQVVFQVKWADPADVSKISTINYGAAFLDNLNPKPISAANAFLTLFNIASVNPLAPTTTDFFTLVGDPTDKLARSLNQSGVIDVALRGSLDDEPVLDVFKQISNTLTKTVNAGDGSNSLDVVRTGEKLTFIIALSNNGPSPAEEVYVTERMPDHCTYVAKSAVLSGATTPSKTKSTLVCTPDADGHHLVFTGMHMEPYDTVTFTYTVLVDASLVVPAPTDPPLLLEVGPFSCGSGSITHTPEGFATSLFIRVIGTTNLYAQPYSTLLVPTPQVILNADKKTTSDTLDVLYLRTPSAQPLKDQKAVIDPTHPPVYIDGVERIYIHYENFGNAGASGVKVTFPVLANTAFYRASWVTLTPNPNPGAMPTMPGTIIKPPTGGSITAPAKGAESGDVVFNLTTLAAGGKGDVMVEFLVLASGVQATSAHAGNGTEMITITDSLAAAAARPAPRTSGTRTQDVPLVPLIGAHQSQALAGVLRLDSSYLAAHGGLVPPTPTFSVMRQISKQNVIPGEKFTITLLGMNNGGVDCIPLMLFRVPDNTVLISVGDYIPDFPRSQPGQLYGQALYSHNNSANGSLKPHTAGGYVITLQATAAAGNSIVLSGTHMDLPNHDSVAVAPATINIVDAATLANRANPDHFQVFGCSFSQLNNGVRLIELGGGNVIAQGGGNVIAQGGGNLLGQDGSGVVAQGGGNLIAVQNPSTLGFVSTSSLLANNSYAITSAKIGNLVVQATTAVIAQGGGNVVAQGGGNLVPPVSSNVVAQGGGNVIGNGSAGVIGNGSAGVIGNGSAGVVAQGGGNVVAQGGGNVVAAGGGNVVAQGGGNLLAGGGNVIGEHSNGIIGEHSNGVIGEHSSGVIGNGSAGIVSAGGGN